MKMEIYMKGSGAKHLKTEEENSMKQAQASLMKENGKIIRKMDQDCLDFQLENIMMELLLNQ